MIQPDGTDPWNTPLMSVAARAGNVEAVRKLLEEGKRPDDANNRGWTPLHEAADAGQVACAALLLSHDRDIKDLRTVEGETPLFLAVNEESKLDVMKLLLNHSADVNLGNNEHVTPLHEACELDSLPCAQLLLESGADVNAPDAFGNRPIHEAIRERSVEMVNLLLRYQVDLKVRNLCGFTPLMVAASKGFHEVIKKLDKPELNIINERSHRQFSGYTALMLAVREGGFKTTKALLEMGADANIIFMEDDVQQTALHLAARSDDPRLVECLVEVTDVEKVGECTNPIVYAIDNMQVKSIELLLEWMKGHSELLRIVNECETGTLWPDYTMTGPVSYLLYHKAEQVEALDVLRLLLKYGCPVNAYSTSEAPPLAAITASSARKAVKKECIQILLDHGADADHPFTWEMLSSLPAAWWYACNLHPDEKWLIRLLMSASRKCDPDTLLSVVCAYSAMLDGGELFVYKAAIQHMLDLALELGFTDNSMMFRIWRRFGGTGPCGERLQNQEEEETSEYDLTVPEILTPTSLSKLCRIVIRRHYCLSDLKKYNLPSVVNDFLNYVF